MRFDTLAGEDPISPNSYSVEPGNSGPSTPYRERIIQHTSVNGNINIIDMGSRLEKLSEFNIIDLTNSEFLALENFLNNNVGKKIQLTEENDHEKIFLENFPSPSAASYYVYLLKIGDYQEENFSQKRKTFRVKIQVALAGVNSTDEINSTRGKYNVLVKVNTIQADIVSSTKPDVLDSDGDPIAIDTRWHDTVNNKVFVHTGETVVFSGLTAGSWNPTTRIITQTGAFSGYTFTLGDKLRIKDTASLTSNAIPDVYEISEKISDDQIRLVTNEFSPTSETGVEGEDSWADLFYDVPADNSAQGLFGGIFFWSTFFDMSSSDPEIDDTWTSGILNYKSVRFGGQSINVEDGPSIARKEGFSFSVNNADRFWKFIVDNKIPLFGARVELFIWRDFIGNFSLTKAASGKNITNEFSYTDYKFQVEPFLLNNTVDFPRRKINPTEQRYRNVRSDVIGKTPYLTYGEFDRAALQNISKKKKALSVERFNPPFVVGQPSDQNVEIITGFINRNDLTEIFVNSTGLTDVFGFKLNINDINNINAHGGFTIKVLSDTNAADDGNIDEVRIIESVADVDVDGFYLIKLKTSLPIQPPAGPGTKPFTDDTIRFSITNNSFSFQMNEAPSNFFGIYNPTTGRVANSSNKRVFFLAENGKEFIDIPVNGFSVNVDNNIISFTPDAVDDPSSFDTFNFIGKGALIVERQFAPIIFSDINNVTFQDSGGSSGVAPDAGWGKSTHYLGFIQTLTGSRNIVPANRLVDEPPPTGYFRSDLGYHVGVPLTFSSTRYRTRVAMVEESSPTNSKRFLRYYFNSDSISITFPGLADNAAITAFETPVIHRSDLDSQLTDGSSVRLGVNFKLFIQTFVRHRVSSSASGEFRRYDPSGIYIVMAVRRRDGTRRYDNSWEHMVEANRMGTGEIDRGQFPGQNVGRLDVNTIPDGDLDGAFAAGTQIPAVNWDYSVDYIFDDRSDRNTSALESSYRFGDRAYIKNIPAIDKFDGAKWIDEDIAGPSDLTNGKKILHNSIFPTNNVFILDAATPPNLITSVEGTDHNAVSKLQGRDLFDISNLFTSPQEWPDVEAFEFYFISRDSINSHTANPTGDEVASFLDRRIEMDMEFVEGPVLIKQQDFSIEDRPTFSAVSGKTLRTWFGGPTTNEHRSAIVMTKDILETMFPGKLNFGALNILANQSNRQEWLFRRQFTSARKSDGVIKELLLNLWAVMVFDENDSMTIKTLNPEDLNISNPNQTFTDGDILKDSFKNPKFRDLRKMFNRFELKFDFDPASEFSKALPENRNVDFLADEPGSSADSELKTLMRFSFILNGTRNTYSKSFNYHYDGDILPLRRMVINHYAWNAWTIKFKTTIDRIIGSNGIKLMDLVSVDSHHFTDVPVEGFIVGVRPNVYDATCEFTVWIPRPPGYSGILCDPFNDALFTGRGTLPENDAGSTGRTLGSFTQKDAGDSPRKIEC